MCAFLVFFAQLTGSIVLGTLIAYPVFLALASVFDFEFHRVASRCMMFLLLVSLYYVLRRTGVADWQSLGYREPPREFVGHLLRGVLLGVLLIAPLLATVLALGLRVADVGGREFSELAGIALQGLTSGLAVALIEETYFRGAMYGAIDRESGPLPAVLLTSLTYAVLHFFGGKYLLRVEEPGWLSGLTIVADAAARLALRPAEILDSLLALAAVGVLLALVRLRTRSISWCIGLHAGWVGSIAATKKLSALEPAASGGWLVGSYDGVIGWLALCWMACLALFALPLWRRVPNP